MASKYIHRDKENEVYAPVKRNIPTTPKEQRHKTVLKRHFNTPPLDATTKIPLREKNIDQNKKSRTPLRKRNIPQGSSSKGSLFLKLQDTVDDDDGEELDACSVDRFEAKDAALEQFLKHEQGQDIELEIVPEREAPLEDYPEDGISFKEIDLERIYATPFHVIDPGNESENDLELSRALDTSHVHKQELKWELPNGLKTPVSLIKAMDIRSTGGQKRYMSETVSSVKKERSSITKSRQNLFSKLIDEHDDKSDGDDGSVNEQVNSNDELVLTDNTVNNDDLRALFYCTYEK